MPTSVVTDIGQAFMTSITAALTIAMAAIPKIIGFLIVLIIGWLIASAIAAIVARVLRAVKFNDLAVRSGFSSFVEKMGVKTDSAGLLADITKWFIRLIVLVVAFDLLGVPAVSAVLQQLLFWLPNVIVALIVLVVGGLAANALYSLVRGSAAEAGFTNPDILASIARVTVWAFAIIVALTQIGIATAIINTLFMGIVAALALAIGLAFGLGGRDVAGQMVRDWYGSAQQNKPKVEKAMQNPPTPPSEEERRAA